MKYKFEQLINRNYKATVSRGLITRLTKARDFLRKIQEEYKEAVMAHSIETEERYIEELTDIAAVAINNITHLGYNFINEFEKVVQKNEKRANDVLKHKQK